MSLRDTITGATKEAREATASLSKKKPLRRLSVLRIPLLVANLLLLLNQYERQLRLYV